MNYTSRSPKLKSKLNVNKFNVRDIPLQFSSCTKPQQVIKKEVKGEVTISFAQEYLIDIQKLNFDILYLICKHYKQPNFSLIALI